MLPFASAVHAARSRPPPRRVATFGKVRVAPNGANAIPSGACVAGRPRRRRGDPAVVVDAIRRSAAARQAATSSNRGEAESITPIVEFPEGPRARLQAALSRFGDVPVLPTAAGHDAGILSAKVPTAMLFVRNPTGVSHSPTEYAEIATAAPARRRWRTSWPTGCHRDQTRSGVNTRGWAAIGRRLRSGQRQRRPDHRDRDRHPAPPGSNGCAVWSSREWPTRIRTPSTGHCGPGPSVTAAASGRGES